MFNKIKNSFNVKSVLITAGFAAAGAIIYLLAQEVEMSEEMVEIIKENM